MEAKHNILTRLSMVPAGKKVTRPKLTAMTLIAGKTAIKMKKTGKIHAFFIRIVRNFPNPAPIR